MPYRVKGLDRPFLVVGRQMGVPQHPIERSVPHKVHPVIQRNPTLDKVRGEGMTQVVKAQVFKTRS